MSELSIIILAAGKGTRMRSARPKVLHRLAHKPLLGHVLDCAAALRPTGLRVVYGHGGEQVPAAFPGAEVTWVEQAERLGTGHAVAQALPGIPDGHRVLVLYGDVPLLSAASLQGLLETPAEGLGLLTVTLDDPGGYGRVVRDDAGRILRIVEEKDADPSIRALREINTGILVAPAGRLRAWVETLDNHNAQGEYYLTDIVAKAVAENLPLASRQPERAWEVLGVNDQRQLAELERHYQRQRAEELMAEGVALRDPARLDVRGEVSAGREVEIDINVILEGRVKLGDGVKIGPNCILREVDIAENTEILANSLIEEAVIGANCRVGPFARLRPATVLANHAHVGNFVEIKKSSIGPGSKINHLSYIGDTEMGADVNIGAGTITCNYDGAHKHKTIIGDDVFVGSDTQLVAPVRVGDGATLGAGSTLTRDAPANALTLSRVAQKTVTGWKRPRKK